MPLKSNEFRSRSLRANASEATFPSLASMLASVTSLEESFRRILTSLWSLEFGLSNHALLLDTLFLKLWSGRASDQRLARLS